MGNKIKILVKKLNEQAKIPCYAHDGDVGMDFFATDVEYDAEKDMYIYHTGLSFESDKNLAQFVFLRSSNRNTNAYLCNHVGIVDTATYRGEVLICMKNRDSIQQIAHSEATKAFISALNVVCKCDNTLPLKDAVESATEVFMNTEKRILSDAQELKYAPYQVGDKIAQMVFFNCPTVELEEVDNLSSTTRGDGGFGSSGK